MHFKIIGKLIVVLLALAATGVAKLPLERHLATELRAARLLPEPLDLDTREALGQTSFAIVLGGLRSLVASMLNLEAHNHWERQEWFELEENYRTITILQPRVRYYWETAAWHLAYNAYADYGDKPNIPDARRRTLQREFQQKGAAFLEQGVRNLPDDWRMWEALASLHRDPHKERDLPAAAAAYEGALACPDAPLRVKRFYLYVLVLIKEREEEAWQLVREIWAEPANRQFPSVRSLRYALQHAHDRKDLPSMIDATWPDRGTALQDLGWHWNRRDEGLPMHGVPEAISFLLRGVEVPPGYDPLQTAPGRWRGFPADFPQSR